MFEINVEITNVGESMHFESVLFPTQRQTIPFVDDPRGPTENPRRFHPVEFSQEKALVNV